MLTTINKNLTKILKQLLVKIAQKHFETKYFGTPLHDFRDFSYFPHSYIFLPKKRWA
jgi:hypothetical protein